MNRCTVCNVNMPDTTNTTCDICHPCVFTNSNGETYISSPEEPLAESITVLLLLAGIIVPTLALALSIRF